MSLSPGTRDEIRRHWADLLGCVPAAFEQSGVTVTERSGRTVRLIRRAGATVVAAPERVSGAFTRCRTELDNAPLTEAGNVVQHAFSDQSTEFVTAHGPAVLGYVDSAAFSPVTADAQLLDDDDERAVDRLRRRVPDEEWQRASPTFRPGRTAGLFRADELVAVATLTDPPFPDIGVVVDPDHRAAGAGRRVVSRVVSAAFERNSATGIRYRTPESESASLRLAASLGFERWASEAVVVLD
ncbi:MAG: GNAT family N-acetyltransferase [Haloarcula sp.]